MTNNTYTTELTFTTTADFITNFASDDFGNKVYSRVWATQSEYNTTSSQNWNMTNMYMQISYTSTLSFSTKQSAYTIFGKYTLGKLTATSYSRTYEKSDTAWTLRTVSATNITLTSTFGYEYSYSSADSKINTITFNVLNVNSMLYSTNYSSSTRSSGEYLATNFRSYISATTSSVYKVTYNFNNLSMNNEMLENIQLARTFPKVLGNGYSIAICTRTSTSMSGANTRVFKASLKNTTISSNLGSIATIYPENANMCFRLTNYNFNSYAPVMECYMTRSSYSYPHSNYYATGTYSRSFHEDNGYSSLGVYAVTNTSYNSMVITYPIQTSINSQINY